MGSSCCGSKKANTSPKVKTNESNPITPIEIAQNMKKTKTGKTVTKLKNRKFVTKGELKEIRNKCNYDMRTVLSEPFDICNQITENLFLTGIGGLTAEDIQNNQIKCIVNVSYELPIHQIQDIEAIRIPVEDVGEEEISLYFDCVSDRINSWIQKNYCVVVHCVCGISRSATLVMAYLMKYKRMSLKESYDYVKERRSIVCPNISFIKQLIAFEKQLFGKTSVKMIEMKIKSNKTIAIPDIYSKAFKENTLTLESIEATVDLSRSLSYFSVNTTTGSSLSNN